MEYHSVKLVNFISIRAAQSKHNHFSNNIIEKNNLKNTKSEPFFGDKEGMQSEDMIAQSKGRVFLEILKLAKKKLLK